LFLLGTEEAATNTPASSSKTQRGLNFEQGIADSATDKLSKARSLCLPVGTAQNLLFSGCRAVWQSWGQPACLEPASVRVANMFAMSNGSLKRDWRELTAKAKTRHDCSSTALG